PAPDEPAVKHGMIRIRPLPCGQDWSGEVLDAGQTDLSDGPLGLRQGQPAAACKRRLAGQWLPDRSESHHAFGRVGWGGRLRRYRRGVRADGGEGRLRLALAGQWLELWHPEADR